MKDRLGHDLTPGDTIFYPTSDNTLVDYVFTRSLNEVATFSEERPLNPGGELDPAWNGGHAL